MAAIPAAVPFPEAAVIPDDIRTKCKLPAQQTEALSRHLKTRGFAVATDRLRLDLQLADASESGKGVLGRGRLREWRRSVAARAGTRIPGRPIFRALRHGG